MNKEYTYIDGKVIISDENGKQKPVEYYDNLDAVLVQENIIETMENRISELEKDSQYYKNNNTKHYIPSILPIVGFMTTVGGNLIYYFLFETNPFVTSVDSMFGVVNQAVLLSSTFSIGLLPLGTFMEFSLYRQHRDSLKKEKGVNSELDFLQKQIVEERQVLEDLKKEKKRDEEDKGFRVTKVDDEQQLEVLKGYLSLYYDLGYNGKKYLKYYKQGKLNDKLKKDYNDVGIEIVKEYLEEKGPSLVKRKKFK